ncbi:MAG: hypothetical protein AAF558_05995 [Verrucomicrobiota bacterium]
MNIIRISILSILSLIAVTLPVISQTVVARYEFTGDSAASTDTDVSSVASDLTVGAGIPALVYGQGNPNPGAFVDSTDISSSQANVLANNEYWEFSVTPTGSFNLTQLSFDHRSINNLGAGSSFFVRSSVDSFASDLASYAGGSFGWTERTVDLTGGGFDSLASVTFRLYGVSQFSILGRGFALDNVELQANAVPEPSALILSASALIILTFMRSRQYQRKP